MRVLRAVQARFQPSPEAAGGHHRARGRGRDGQGRGVQEKAQDQIVADRALGGRRRQGPGDVYRHVPGKIQFEPATRLFL